AGLLLCFIINIWLPLLMLLYVLVSKAYSWKKIRLKKYAVLSWLVVIIFQGAYTFLMVNMCCENRFNPDWFDPKNIQCMMLASLLIGGFYPLTQIYQHEEDSARGDHTISYKLGVLGTFIFSASLFIIGTALAFYYFINFYSLQHFLLFNICLLPVTAYFLYWFAITLRNRAFADFKHSMRMTIVSSLCMIVCFTVIYFLNHPL
ncbi:MAG: hypothetical protein JWO06_183, partial [Bacteroidota bacterium]|nr:hypothetical protein [Bacteroidota bacterium]